MAVVAVALLMVIVAGVPAQPRPVLLEAREEMRLDAVEHDLPDVRQFFVSPRGELVVPIPQDMTLRRYSPEGRYLGSIGRAGGGPGEFRFVGSVGWVGDSMWVRDVNQFRFTVFSPQGEYRSEMHFRDLSDGVRLPDGTRYRTVGPQALVHGGALVIGQDAAGQSTLLARSAAGAIRPLLDLGNRENPRATLHASRYGIPMPFVFSPRLLISAVGDRAIFVSAYEAPGARTEVTIVAALVLRDTLATWRLLLPAAPIRGSVRDSALRAIRERRMTEGPPDLAEQLYALAVKSMPKHHSALEFATLGMDGSVWLELRRTTDRQQFLVLDSLGRDAGMLELKRGSRVRQATLSTVWVTELDDDGLASIVRYSVRPPR